MRDLAALQEEHGPQEAPYRAEADERAKRAARRYAGEQPPPVALVDADTAPTAPARPEPPTAPKRARRRGGRPRVLGGIAVEDYRARRTEAAQRVLIMNRIIGWRMLQARLAAGITREQAAYALDWGTGDGFRLVEEEGSPLTMPSFLYMCQFYQVRPEAIVKGLTREINRVYKLAPGWTALISRTYDGPGWTPEALRQATPVPAADRPDPGGA